jgi:hypothetical protein
MSLRHKNRAYTYLSFWPDNFEIAALLELMRGRTPHYPLGPPRSFPVCMSGQLKLRGCSIPKNIGGCYIESRCRLELSHLTLCKEDRGRQSMWGIGEFGG